MPTEEEDDLEAYWADVRSTSPISIVSDKTTDFRAGLEMAELKTAFDLKARFKDFEGQTVDVKVFAEITSLAIGAFMRHWYDDLHTRDPAALIEVILDGLRLPCDQLKAFVRALPLGVVERVIRQGAVGTVANGVHGLMAVEFHQRSSAFTQDYTLVRDPMGALVVTCYPRKTSGRPVVFRLDERFDLREDPKDGVQLTQERR